MSCNCNKRNPNGWNIKDCDTVLEEEAAVNHHHHHHCCSCDCNHHHCPKPHCNCSEELVSQSRIGDMESCCDFDGDCGVFETCNRNRFWPDFAHPRFLCCKDLYSEC